MPESVLHPRVCVCACGCVCVCVCLTVCWCWWRVGCRWCVYTGVCTSVCTRVCVCIICVHMYGYECVYTCVCLCAYVHACVLGWYGAADVMRSGCTVHTCNATLRPWNTLCCVAAKTSLVTPRVTPWSHLGPRVTLSFLEIITHYCTNYLSCVCWKEAKKYSALSSL